MRAIRPKEEQDESIPHPSAVPEAPKTTKRKCISSACIPCRKRKSKCDGGMPNCSTCTAVYHTPCAYDVDGDHRRKAALRRDIEALKEQNGALGVIVASIRSSTESEVEDIVQQIRADEDLETIAESLKRNVTLLERSDAKPAEGDLSNMIGSPSPDQMGVFKHFGSTSNLGLVSDTEPSSASLRTPKAWTLVTRDSDLVEHLMGLYFCWSHPFYVFFSKELFLHDMAKRRSKYCSPFLVNAILAIGCSMSDRPEARANPVDPSTAGDHFFAEAKRLLDSNESLNITTVQGLALMGLREASCDRDSSGSSYTGRSMRMAIELGLHLCFGASNNKFGPTEFEVRKITFWGLFTYDTAWSICIGRISQIPRTAINLDKPSVLTQLETQLWSPYTDFGFANIPGADQPSYTNTLLYQFGLLSEIVNDTVFMFYAPRERFTSNRLLDFHRRYTKWFAHLPQTLQLGDVSTPHVLVLHMYYHTVVLHLFRPFLKVVLTNSSLSPREVCTSCSNTITALIATYRQVYGFRRSTVFVMHIIVTASIIDLLNLPDATAARNLQLGVAVLRESSVNHAFAIRCLDIISALARQWNIELPIEVSQELDLPRGLPVNSFGNAPSPQGWPATPSSATTYSQQQETYVQSNSAAEMPYYAINPQPNTAPQPADLFWSPFPDQSVPLQAMHPSEPMDISTMIDVQDPYWDQLNKDGFKIADVNGAALGPPAYALSGSWGSG